MITITPVQKAVAHEVLEMNRRIAVVANEWGIHPTTVRRYMDKYTEWKLQSKAGEAIENAYLVHIELHVGNDTRHVHQVIYAPNKEEAEQVVAAMKPDYRGNENPSYQLQVKSGPFKLTENLWMLEEY